MTTLVIMAAGLGSRFKGGIKQLERIGPNGEIIMDYSVHDAVLAGFDRIVFVISHRIEEEFRQVVGSRIEGQLKGAGVECAYVYQCAEDVPVPVDWAREKPWGTGQAVLAARDVLDGPFAVINADDFYGRNSFRVLQRELLRVKENEALMAGFRLGNTLSEHGTVTRGLCREEGGYLTGITETRLLRAVPGGAESGGVFYPADMRVSMNMWGFDRSFEARLYDGFREFLMNIQDRERDEFVLPEFVGELVKGNELRVRVLETEETWFGMTYREDAEKVRGSIRELTERGVYLKELYGDVTKR